MSLVPVNTIDFNSGYEVTMNCKIGLENLYLNKNPFELSEIREQIQASELAQQKKLDENKPVPSSAPNVKM